MAILFITHDLGVVANMAGRGGGDLPWRDHGGGRRRRHLPPPQHPYLQALFRALPRLDMDPGERLVPLREIKVGPIAPAGGGRSR